MDLRRPSASGRGGAGGCAKLRPPREDRVGRVTVLRVRQTRTGTLRFARRRASDRLRARAPRVPADDADLVHAPPQPVLAAVGLRTTRLGDGARRIPATPLHSPIIYARVRACEEMARAALSSDPRIRNSTSAPRADGNTPPVPAIGQALFVVATAGGRPARARGRPGRRPPRRPWEPRAS